MKLISLSVLGLILVSMVSGQVSSTTTTPHAKMSSTTTLKIYTYESLMQDVYYNIEGNFSAFTGINVSITRFSDANQLVTELKSGAKPDIVIGIDNALINMFNASDYFVQFDNASVLQNINPTLIQNLDPSHYLVPYDYGVIALTYLNQVVNSSTYPFLTNNFTFNDLLNSNLASKIILENPKISSTGLGFLLSTIATYGDNSSGITGVLGKDWKPFWENVGKKITITDSWNSALAAFNDSTNGFPVMVSYLTDPAYNYCLYNDTSTSSVITTLSNGTQSGWFQIEGLGIVKNSPHLTAANEFMSWFLGKDLQEHIPESQWMFPSNTLATIPSCFTQAGIPNLNAIVPLNDYLSTANLKTYMSTWINEWEQVNVTKNIPGFKLPIITLVVSFLAVITISRRKRKI